MVEVLDLLYKNPKMDDDIAVNYIDNIMNFYKSNQSKSKRYIIE